MIVYREAASLARDLGVEVRTLYALSNTLPAHYHTVEIPKADGGVRRLTVPDEALKRVQRAILNNLLVHMPVSPCAMAYRYGGGAIRNAARHVGRPQVLRNRHHRGAGAKAGKGCKRGEDTQLDGIRGPGSGGGSLYRGAQRRLGRSCPPGL